MKKTWAFIFLGVCLLGIFFHLSQEEGSHLFILSGQSNMAELRPEESFTPLIEEKFGKENVIIVKDAYGGQPIRRWYREWKPLEGDEPKARPDLYDSLLTKVYKATENEKIDTVTFIWMQGERDAREKLGEVYEVSLTGLYRQLSDDLNRDDIHFIIGRLNDFNGYPHWELIRNIQVKLAESNSRFDWVDTDDLNDGVNRQGEEIRDDLHMSEEGYVMLGKRFADKAITFIESRK